MAPPRKNPRRTLKKKKKQKLLEETNFCSDDDSVLSKMEDVSTSVECTTPKAQKYRIPEISTCPPAPKKRKLVSSCSLRRMPISFFDPPDIELFFASHLASIYTHVHTHVR